ncbi:MAG: DNA-binding protein [Actinobacteria bacterium]|nr:DNA-binding protein [Actinomycetota bacterium]NBY15054.1 DNA-binding protein [Actinomycetota bacterium]
MRRRRKLSFFSSQQEIDAANLQDVSESLGAQAAADVEAGEIVRVHGAIRALRIRPNTTVPMVEADIWDGSGLVSLIWLGRRSIAGITPGRALVVEGRLTKGPAGQPTLFNPRYELLATGE